MHHLFPAETIIPDLQLEFSNIDTHYEGKNFVPAY